MKSLVDCSEDQTISQQKSHFRRLILSKRRLMGEFARQKASEIICEKFFNLPTYQQAQSVALFAPFADEVNIWPIINDLLQKNKTVSVPRVASKKERKIVFHPIKSVSELKLGAYGILEPPSSFSTIFEKEFDFIIVPAVAVDFQKKRLGYGGGFYDKFLLRMKNVLTCSPLFCCQFVSEVPIQDHDCTVQKVITEE